MRSLQATIKAAAFAMTILVSASLRGRSDFTAAEAISCIVQYVKNADIYQMKKGGAVYIMTNEYNTTLYVGVSSDLKGRVYSHKNDLIPGSFTAKYGLHKLVYYEGFHLIEDAIRREKQLKAGSRIKKEALINRVNPEWKDLYDEILLW